MFTYKHSNHLELIGYFDSNFGRCIDSGKSTLGYIYLLANGVVSWRSIKQTIIASPTMEVLHAMRSHHKHYGGEILSSGSKLLVFIATIKPLYSFLRIIRVEVIVRTSI